MSTNDDVAVWDAEAADFDLPADHGLRDPATRSAWRDVLLGSIPVHGGRVADLGCGTGTLSILLAEAGFDVDGVDFSPKMIEVARAKLGASARLSGNVSYRVADAAMPPLESGTYDVVMCRHVLWALPDPVAVLERWTRLLAPAGRLVLVEGRWANGAGLPAEETVRLAEEATAGAVALTRLTDPVYWGRPIEDDRYLVVVDPRPH